MAYQAAARLEEDEDSKKPFQKKWSWGAKKGEESKVKPIDYSLSGPIDLCDFLSGYKIDSVWATKNPASSETGSDDHKDQGSPFQLRIPSL